MGDVDVLTRMRFRVSRRASRDSYPAVLDPTLHLIGLTDSQGALHWITISNCLRINLTHRLHEIGRCHKDTFHLSAEFSTADKVGA